MIKNIVFDINGVLVRTDHQAFRRSGYSLLNVLVSVFIDSTDIWKDYNCGLYENDDQVSLLLQKKYPLMKKIIAQTMERNKNRLYVEIQPMCDLLRKLKKDYRVFILSNQTVDDYRRLLKHEVIASTEGIISCNAGCRKPDPEIFEKLCRQYDLLPQETIFIDDFPNNIAAARKLGFQAIQHISGSSTEEQVYKLLKEKVN